MDVAKEFHKRRGAVNTALDVYYVPKGYRVKWVAHPRLGGPFAAIFRRELSMGWHPVKSSGGVDGIKVTNDPEKARADDRTIYVPAYEVDKDYDMITTPGGNEVLLVGREAVVRKFVDLDLEEFSAALKSSLGGQSSLGASIEGVVEDKDVTDADEEVEDADVPE